MTTYRIKRFYSESFSSEIGKMASENPTSTITKMSSVNPSEFNRCMQIAEHKVGQGLSTGNPVSRQSAINSIKKI